MMVNCSYNAGRTLTLELLEIVLADVKRGVYGNKPRVDISTETYSQTDRRYTVDIYWTELRK